MSGTKRIKVTFRGCTGLVAHHTERPEEILDPGRLAGMEGDIFGKSTNIFGLVGVRLKLCLFCSNQCFAPDSTSVGQYGNRAQSLPSDMQIKLGQAVAAFARPG
jgi:hypothetical protein